MKEIKYEIGFIKGLQLLFIALKLTDHVDWAWWIVLAPISISLFLDISIIALEQVHLVLKKKKRKG